jgi:hypothetical protein
MCATERDADTANDRDPTSLLIPHDLLRLNELRSISGPSAAALRNCVMSLICEAHYNCAMHPTRLAPAFLAALVVGCGSVDADAELRALLAAAETAAEERDTGFFREAIGDAYRDARGNDREALVNLIRGYFLTHQRIEIVSRIDEVTLEGAGAARAVVQAGMLGLRAGETVLSGIDGELYRIELELVDDDGEWRIIGASWRRATGK